MKSRRISLIKIDKILIFMILLIFTMRDIFIKAQIEYLVYVFSVIFIGLNVYKIALKQSIKKSLILPFIIIIIGVAQLTINALLSGIKVSVLGFASLYVYLICWTFFLNNTNSKLKYDFFVSFKSWIVFFGVINAILGLYQYFFDASIMGLVSNKIYGNNELLDLGNVTRRVTGFLGSPQNYSLFMGLALMMLMKIQLNKKKKILFFILILFGGLVSGSRTFTVFLLGAFLAKALSYLKNKKITFRLDKIIYFMIFILIMPIFILYFDYASITISDTFYRIINFKNWPALNVFVKSFNDFNLVTLLFGKGLTYGVLNDYSNFSLDYSQFESYFLSLLNRAGLIQLVITASVFVISIIKTYREKDYILATTGLTLFINAILTPSFGGLQMSFVIWPFILTPVANNGSNRLFA